MTLILLNKCFIRTIFIQLTAIFFVLPIANTSFACSDPYKTNPKFEFVFIHAGVSLYLEKESVNVYEYNPPLYVICGNFTRFANTSEGDVLEPFLIVKQYNYNKRETYTRRNNIWDKDIINSSSIGLENKAMANALFRSAYGMDFYD